MKRINSFLMVSIVCLLLAPTCYAEEKKILNVYAFTGEVPDFIVRKFENETGIEVNFSTYENNEIMYAKLRANKKTGYDVIMPSSYFVDRMRRQNLLEKIDTSKIPNIKNLNPAFAHPSYDPELDDCVPYLWGITGIFYNKKYNQPQTVSKWADFWDKRFYDQLMLLDDTREVFSMALLSLGYSANDKNPEHIKQAFLKLKALMQNVKVFSTDTVVSIIIDEDATVGMAWNGDSFKAMTENNNIKFVFPSEGFVIWVDNFAIPKNAPHKDAAYAFINFMLRADIAKESALSTHYPTANLAAQKLLPLEVQNNPVAYPSKEVLKRGQFQTDVGDDILALYEKYWEELKMSN
ncbi:MAG: spermidine/putrescine ABC transporter substrate-binding protein [Gammaproteobacteria bacterium]